MSRRVCFDPPSPRQQRWTEPLRLWARNALRAYWLSPVLLAAPPMDNCVGRGAGATGMGSKAGSQG